MYKIMLVNNTLIYIQVEKALYQGESDEFIVKVAQSNLEIQKLLEVGFEFVVEKEGCLFFRKRK